MACLSNTEFYGTNNPSDRFSHLLQSKPLELLGPMTGLLNDSVE
jgi:hypothetical protein